ncbi:MAG: ERF family protein [Mycobacterium sp.]
MSETTDLAVADERETLPATAPRTASDDVAALLRVAVEGGLPAESMERLVDLQIKMRAEDARAAFARAYGQMQAKLPPVLKNRHVAHNDTTYATLDEVERTVRPVLAVNGFSYSFTTEKGDDGEREAVCRLRHEQGHTEETRFPMQIDGKARMNETQRVASAASYARRYALLFALGVSTTDTVYDDDGAAGGAVEPITEEQAADLAALAEEVGADTERFFRWVSKRAPGVKSWSDIPASVLDQCVTALNAKRGA